MELYIPGKWSAGTTRDTEYARGLAIGNWLFRMRLHGELQLPEVVAQEPHRGSVLPIDFHQEPGTFLARFYPGGERFVDHTFELARARVVKANGGVVQIAGDEYDHALARHVRQTWLCTPTAERGLQILAAMARRAGGGV